MNNAAAAEGRLLASDLVPKAESAVISHTFGSGFLGVCYFIQR